MAADSDRVQLLIRVSPNARKTEFTGWTADEKGRPVLLMRLHAPPVDGKANDELLDYLAEQLGCGKRELILLRGTASRLKVVEMPAEYQGVLEKRVR